MIVALIVALWFGLAGLTLCLLAVGSDADERSIRRYRAQRDQFERYFK